MADTSDWRPRANPWLIAGAVMAATIMEVLDTSVANVALNHIAGNLSASVDDATWVLTSYLVFKRDRPAGYRLVRTVFWPPQVSHHLHLHFHAGVRLVRLGQQPGHAYPGAYRPGGQAAVRFNRSRRRSCWRPFRRKSGVWACRFTPWVWW
jgi:hypothetical protein